MIKSRWYRYQGPDINTVRLEIGPSVQVDVGTSNIAFQVRWDDAEGTEASLDAAMAPFGLYPDPKADASIIGLKSPDGSLWRLNIDNLGVLLPKKIP